MSIERKIKWKTHRGCREKIFSRKHNTTSDQKRNSTSFWTKHNILNKPHLLCLYHQEFQCKAFVWHDSNPHEGHPTEKQEVLENLVVDSQKIVERISQQSSEIVIDVIIRKTFRLKFSYSDKRDSFIVGILSKPKH